MAPNKNFNNACVCVLDENEVALLLIISKYRIGNDKQEQEPHRDPIRVNLVGDPELA